MDDALTNLATTTNSVAITSPVTPEGCGGTCGATCTPAVVAVVYLWQDSLT